jgi:hypothetical protein
MRRGIYASNFINIVAGCYSLPQTPLVWEPLTLGLPFFFCCRLFPCTKRACSGQGPGGVRTGAWWHSITSATIRRKSNYWTRLLIMFGNHGHTFTFFSRIYIYIVVMYCQILSWCHIEISNQTCYWSPGVWYTFFN